MESNGVTRTTISSVWATARPARVVAALAAALFLSSGGVHAQTSGTDSQDKNLDIRSSVGDLHMGSDADARATGLPVYPGARLRKHEENRDSANLALFTSAFGFKLVVANYDSDDAPSKVIAFYRGKLKKYGKVLECHTSKNGADISPQEDNDDSAKSKELKCDNDNTGSGVELKVGTEDNQHVVAVEPAENGSGSTFAIVYVYSRGKQADI
ncbi:MAG: hypothetical protein WB952_25780 [Terriglobales bacterium]